MRGVETVDLAEVVRWAGELADAPGRAVLGITGPPGSGKTVLARALVGALDGRAVTVPMDGFHLAHELLEARGTAPIKGAPETFDAWGYRALLRRLRDPDDALVHAPRFDRALEQPIGSALPVPASVPLVVTEGNYLLLPDQPWADCRTLCDEVWYLDPGEERRLDWLVRRHQAYGRDLRSAQERAGGSDARNADLVRAHAGRADRRLRLPTDPGVGALT